MKNKTAIIITAIVINSTIICYMNQFAHTASAAFGLGIGFMLLLDYLDYRERQLARLAQLEESLKNRLEKSKAKIRRKPHAGI